MRDGLYFTGLILFAAVPLYLGWDLIVGSVLLTWGLTFGGGTAIAALLASAYRLQIEVKKSRRELERNRQELSFAHEVQETLLPRPMDNRGGLEFAGICLPARGVSGDYYDILSLKDDRLALAIADISGKGVPAAILMSNLQAVLRTVTKTSSHPLDVCARLNQHLYEVTRDSRFATFFYAEWHPDRRRLSYINAGHNPPILLGSQGTRRLTKGGLPLGLFPQVDYEMGENSLEPGDMLALYSDGITE